MTKEELPENHPLLKWVVIILGLLIVICVVIIVVTVMARMAGGDKKKANSAGNVIMVPAGDPLPAVDGKITTIATETGHFAYIQLQEGESAGTAQLNEGLILLPVLKDGTPVRFIVLKARNAELVSQMQINRAQISPAQLAE